MVEVTNKILEEKLDQLHEDGIPEDLIQKIKNRIKDEKLELEQLEYLLNKIYINFNEFLACFRVFNTFIKPIVQPYIKRY